MILAWILAASLVGTLLSLAIAALVAFRVQERWIPTLVSFAVGAMLGAAFLDILPHLFEETKDPGRTAAWILGGLLAFFVLEKLLLWRHHHHHGEEGEAAVGPVHGHGGGRSVGWMIIFGDGFHNVTDGVIIASAFLTDVKIGVVTSLAIIAHEIPQEIGDFLVLLHSGFGRAKALALNVLSGLAATVGAVAAYFALSAVNTWIPEVLAVAAASMIYIAVADLIPGLHRRTALGESLAQVLFIALGIACIWGVHAALLPGA
ncbi:MAG TPA: ZIP family metal transporter [Usitatibacter sp.]|nr:ZIP family metal transporter [Usitatibacter sp.]